MSLQGNKTANTLIMLSAFVPNIFLTDTVMAQATAQDTLKISAKVTNPLAVTPSFSFSLNFQSFAVAGSGTFTVQPTGASTITSGITLGGAVAGTAIFKVPQSVEFTLSIPTFGSGNDIIMTNGGGGAASKEITCKSILFASRSGLSNITATLNTGSFSVTGIKVTNPAETGKMNVGASIVFGANQVVGTYQGSFILRITL